MSSSRALSLASALVVVALAAAVPSPGFELTLHLSPRPGGEERLETLFWQVASPEHTEYLRHRTVAELADIIGASDEDTAAAQAWLVALGGETIRVAELGTTITASFSGPRNHGDWTANGLPSKKLQPRGVILVTRRDFSVPPASDTNAMARSRKPARAADNFTAAAYSVSEQKQAYGIPVDLQASNDATLQMVWGPGTFGYSKKDLALFKLTQCPLLNMDKIHFDTENQGTPGGDNYGEGNLDTRMISSFGLNVTTLVSNTNTSMSTEEGKGFGLAMLDFVTELASRKTVPQVLSLSLGSLSAFSCDLMCKEAVKLKVAGVTEATCTAYMQSQRQVCMFESTTQVAAINQALKVLGLRGVSIFGSSGDGGSHWSFEPFPESSIVGRTLNKVGCEFQFPIFPSPSPYVVSVGGTEWNGDGSRPIAWGGSGGGFSWQFGRPAHQDKAVSQYLSSAALPPASSFNATGRGYPDISAVAVDGTSESSPTVAGIFSMLTDMRLSAGLPPLGFVAPRIWQVASQFPGSAFESVTEGNSKTTCATGFPAAPAWDPVTGWGRPVWKGLVQHFAADN